MTYFDKNSLINKYKSLLDDHEKLRDITSKDATPEEQSKLEYLEKSLNIIREEIEKGYDQ